MSLVKLFTMKMYKNSHKNFELIRLPIYIYKVHYLQCIHKRSEVQRDTDGYMRYRGNI